MSIRREVCLATTTDDMLNAQRNKLKRSKNKLRELLQKTLTDYEKESKLNFFKKGDVEKISKNLTKNIDKDLSKLESEYKKTISIIKKESNEQIEKENLKKIVVDYDTRYDHSVKNLENIKKITDFKNKISTKINKELRKSDEMIRSLSTTNFITLFGKLLGTNKNVEDITKQLITLNYKNNVVLDIALQNLGKRNKSKITIQDIEQEIKNVNKSKSSNNVEYFEKIIKEHKTFSFLNKKSQKNILSQLKKGYLFNTEHVKHTFNGIMTRFNNTDKVEQIDKDFKKSVGLALNVIDPDEMFADDYKIFQEWIYENDKVYKKIYYINEVARGKNFAVSIFQDGSYDLMIAPKDEFENDAEDGHLCSKFADEIQDKLNKLGYVTTSVKEEESVEGTNQANQDQFFMNNTETKKLKSLSIKF